MEKLVKEFRQVQASYIKKGLTEQQVHRKLREHIRDKQPFKSLGSRTNRSTKCTALLIYILPVIFAVLSVCSFMFAEDVLKTVKSTNCLMYQNVYISEITRPVQNCSPCANVRSVPIVKNISTDEFLHNYAYTAVPVLIKDATQSWTAMETFSYEYFKKIYTEREDALDFIEEDCQFFGYNTEFDTLRDALNMSKDRSEYKQGERPWYFGWSNCHPLIEKELRKHYNRPYFLPEGSESSTTDWIFMGGPGPGAFMHLDYVHKPSWQAQISGTKTWSLLPSPECEQICHSFNITVETGDIVVLDTNQWYHSTHIHPGKLSITIGSEYD